MELDEDSLLRLKAGSDRRMRQMLEDYSTRTTLARNLAWAVGGLAGIIFWLGVLYTNHNRDIEQLRTGQGENRQYIRDLWPQVFKQPLPPPPSPVK